MPVVNHEVHESVKHSAGSVYGCWNRDEFKDGYFVKSRMYFPDGKYDFELELIQHILSTEFRFDLSLTDDKCLGCKRRGSGEEYNERIRKEGLK